MPIRSAIAAAAAAVCALTVAVTFSASLLRLVGDPRAYGVTWDVRVGNFADPQAAEQAAHQLAANSTIAAFAGVVTGSPDPLIDGRSVQLLSFAPGKGDLLPAVVEGHAPTQPDEIALGSTTMRMLGKRIGDTVVVASPVGPRQRLRVVGRVIINGGDLNAAVAPGKGAISHVELWRRLDPSSPSAAPQSFFVRLDPASDRRRALQQLQRDFPNTVVFPLKQPDLTHVERVGYLPRAARRPGGAAGARDRHPRAGHRGPTATARPGHPQDPRLRPRPDHPDSGLAGDHLRTGSRADRHAPWGGGRPLGVAAGGRATRGRRGPGRATRPVAGIAAGALLIANLVAAGPGWAAARIQPSTALRAE